MNLKFVVVYENISEPKFNTGHCRVKIKVTYNNSNLPHVPQVFLSMLGLYTIEKYRQTLRILRIL